MLTSAHVVAGAEGRPTAVAGRRVEVFRPGGDRAVGAVVVWCGAAGGRDDAALVLVDREPGWAAPVAPVRWGWTVTDRPGIDCETWGVPELAQRAGRAVEAVQLSGALNPGSGFVGNEYVVDLLRQPPQWSLPGASPWGGLSGAAVCCDRLLVGVVAADRAHSGHGQLNAVPAYVLHHDPAFRAALAEHGGAAAGLEPVELQPLADPGAGFERGVPRSPAGSLRAARQTVPFHGRQELLAELRAWCGRGGFGAWLLHGPGGQGKTRLAHHLAQQLAAERWAVLWPSRDATADRLRGLRDVRKPLLVVVDYAETRTGQLAALVEAAAEHPGSTAFKVLLLARTDGDWWGEATTASSLAQDYLDAAPTRLLAPLESDPEARPDAYRAAARALASDLAQVDGLAEHDWQGTANRLPLPARLGRDAYGNALTLHMTALADLLDANTPGPAGPDTDPGPPAAGGDRVGEEAEAVEDRLLGHERRYWHHSAAARGLAPDLTRGTLETALAAAHLAGAADRDTADALWLRLPALADQPRDRRDSVTAWLTALYPAQAPLPWGTLQPDRLAERHIGRTLDADPRLADHLLDGADDTQTGRLLTVYSRAAGHPVFRQRLDSHLTALCVRRHRQLSAQVISTATRTDHPAPLTTALDAVTTDPATAVEELATLQEQLPRSTRRLGPTALLLARTLTDRRRALARENPAAHLPDLAAALNSLSVRLAEMGQREEALPVIRESVEIRRALARENPAAHLPELAGALNNLAVRLGVLGRHTESLAALREATGHYRALVAENPAAHLPGLALSLNNLAIRLGETGRHEEGLAVIRESVEIRRALARANPEARLPELAGALNNLAIRLGETGRHDEALAVISEATDHYRALAEVNPDAHLPDLAQSLNNLAIRLGAFGRREEGLAVISEAVGHCRALVEENPGAHLPGLARSLNNLAIRLGDMGRREEALEAIREATGHYRVLAREHPEAYLPGLATSLNNLYVDLGAMGRRGEALEAIREATGHYRVLAREHPEAYLPDLAHSLNNLSIALGESGRQQEGLAASREAVGHYRGLVRESPDAHLPDLARSLNNLAIRLGTLGREEEGLAVVSEAVDHYRTLARAHPEAFLDGLAGALNNLSVDLCELGRLEEGLNAASEAVDHYRVLARANPEVFLPGLATSLNNLAIRLGDAERWPESLAAISEAVEIRRALE
ncbi:tetratricopeptide repeat protein [Streptacidiphilus sp. P02-A3a]|nr:tetratricopeptide repeat protein [Streptacidiphilus sp. P02-A3a]